MLDQSYGFQGPIQSKRNSWTSRVICPPFSSKLRGWLASFPLLLICTLPISSTSASVITVTSNRSDTMDLLFPEEEFYVNDGGDYIWSGLISGSGASLVKSGGGRLTLNATRYSGPTIVRDGTLVLASVANTTTGATDPTINGLGSLVSGGRSLLTTSPSKTLYVGDKSSANLMINQSGKLWADNLTIANNPVSRGDVVIDQGELLLGLNQQIGPSMTQLLLVGAYGNGTLTVKNDGVVNSYGSVVVGYLAGVSSNRSGNGRLRVDNAILNSNGKYGNNMLLNFTQAFYVGYQGDKQRTLSAEGRVFLSNHGRINANNGLYLGYGDTPATGVVNANAYGLMQLENDSILRVGDNGTGSNGDSDLRMAVYGVGDLRVLDNSKVIVKGLFNGPTGQFDYTSGRVSGTGLIHAGSSITFGDTGQASSRGIAFVSPGNFSGQVGTLSFSTITTGIFKGLALGGAAYLNIDRTVSDVDQIDASAVQSNIVYNNSALNLSSLAHWVNQPSSIIIKNTGTSTLFFYIPAQPNPLMLNGLPLSSARRLMGAGITPVLTSDNKQLMVSVTGTPVPNQHITRIDNGNTDWSLSDESWSQDGVGTTLSFLDGDAVTFNNTNATLTVAGVGKTKTVANMQVLGASTHLTVDGGSGARIWGI